MTEKLRNNRGFLRAGALKSGAREQWARDTPTNGRVIVEIAYDHDDGQEPRPWAVHLTLRGKWWSTIWFSHLEDARTEFKTLIKHYNH